MKKRKASNDSIVRDMKRIIKWNKVRLNRLRRRTGGNIHSYPPNTIIVDSVSQIMLEDLDREQLGKGCSHRKTNYHAWNKTMS